ncbi:MAG: hypothetical protein ACYDCK_07765 [Thermoplasmatota archaeon]
MPSETDTTTLKANACLIPRAERLAGNPARGWYFAVLVRASLAKMEGGPQ